MSDKTFERSLQALLAVAVLWIIAGITLGLLGTALVVIIGLIIIIGGGIPLIRKWGKTYMESR